MDYELFLLLLQRMKRLSILIPTYNGISTTLVRSLQQQAAKLATDYEIIVADDGSTDPATIAVNRAVNELPSCRYIERKENAGRAAIRNFLATQAQYEWLLFIDSDMVVCNDNFLQRYAETDGADVVDGGVVIGNVMPGNLRSMYEKAAEHEHTVDQRQRHPYHDFHTANFMIRRELMLAHPFDQRFRHYGYEDVLLGKELAAHQIAILHIDNPLSFEVFETNADFVSKTEEGLRTLCQFRHELQGYSRLLDAPIVRKESLLQSFVCLFHRIVGPWERRRLTGPHPSLLIFKAYKLGYYLTYLKTNNKPS